MTETTQASNGKAPDAAVEQFEARVLGWDDLTPGDMLRAKAAKLFGGVDPQEAVEEEPLYATALVIWCLKTRTDPGFTWDQALATPYGVLKVADAPPPPPLLAPGSVGAGSSSKRRTSAPATTLPAAAPAPASGPSST